MTFNQVLNHRISRLMLLSAALCASASPAKANVVGTDMQNFNPLTSGLDFVTVHSSETLKPGIVNLGLFFNYAVNTLPYFDSSPGGRMDFNDTVLGMDVSAGLGLTKNWDIGISFPAILNQSVRDQYGARGEFEQTGSTEVKLNTKIRLLGDDTGGLAVIGSTNVNRTENNPWVGRDAGPTMNLELAADTTFGRVAYGANIGYRIRNSGQPIPGSRVQPLKDQVIASAAASYYMPHLDTKLIGEVFGSFPASNSSADGERSLQSLEALAGLKHDLTQNLALHAGGGLGLIHGVASPDWRVYTGVNYTFGPLWSDDRPNLERVSPPEPVYPPPKVQRFRTGKINFAFDSDQMINNYDEVLTELVNYLKSGFRELIIEGHTDSIGSEAYNQKLSERRARAIQTYIGEKFRIDTAKITIVGLGETQPIADNGNFQGRQSNRRVEFEIIR
jgi:outer membrane protein OmpA-like peptidoglycan-associated protein